MDKNEFSQQPKVAHTEVRYLDIYGNPADPEQAVKIIRQEYDAEGHLIRTVLSIDPKGLLYYPRL